MSILAAAHSEASRTGRCTCQTLDKCARQAKRGGRPLTFKYVNCTSINSFKHSTLGLDEEVAADNAKPLSNVTYSIPSSPQWCSRKNGWNRKMNMLHTVHFPIHYTTIPRSYNGVARILYMKFCVPYIASSFLSQHTKASIINYKSDQQKTRTVLTIF